MRELPAQAQVVVLATSLLGFALWMGLLPSLEPARPDTALVTLLLFLAALLTEFLIVPLRRGGVVSVSTIAHVAAILLLPLPTATTLAGAAVLIQQLAARRPWYKATFNTGSAVVTVAAAALAIRVLGNPLELAQPAPLLSLASLLIVVLTYHLVTSSLLTLLLSQATRRSYRYILRGNMLSVVPELSTAVVGGLVAFVWHYAPLWVVTTLCPAVIAYLVFKYIHRVVTETDSAVETMAQIVDERDHYTYEHSSHVAEYAVLLAEAMRLDPEEVEIITSAARVHDLGKIGVGNSSLYKTGELDEAERAELQAHPVIGARILGHFQGYRRGVKYVLHHHERWDGRGYPDGLKGEEIPLGARIIAVADAFDAMTTDRPYRRALPLDEAFDRIRAGIGLQFDPMVAGHFLVLAPEFRQRVESRPVPLRAWGAGREELATAGDKLMGAAAGALAAERARLEEAPAAGLKLMGARLQPAPRRDRLVRPDQGPDRGRARPPRVRALDAHGPIRRAAGRGHAPRPGGRGTEG
ncbi:MAG: HD-GYP domain-containing protein [Chloroflexi bacterium]|nr:HD-GYP domain-containing protein [Chloroflexota bacterium]